ncbi:MAG: 30S ribosomal protein S27ae [Thermoproteota archaeon]|nr:MAG: 30S ribosomal protein S27ae [Candidatus Korarchaeota archaeon]RLG53915.1 MAG: 30S ribosomal protein S27ae [Candidatus Korarchaeota archaeon]
MTKGKKTSAYRYYKMEGGKLIRLNKKCPRCGSFLAEHRDRRSCGKCGYTEFKQTEA